MEKKIFHSKEVRNHILDGLNSIAQPVRQTLSPKGGNVLYENEMGSFTLTNDGVTIARNISVSNQIENSIVQLVKESALRTNSEAGDGTSTSILLTDTLTKEGLKLVDEGYSWIEVRDKFHEFSGRLIQNIEKTKIEVKNDNDIKNIARISANNDEVIAQDILDVVKTAGEDGMIFLEPNNDSETEIVKDLGFMIKSGIPYQELLTESGKFSVTYTNTPVLITDKRLYYPEEAETILRTAVKANYKSIVIVARDFMGEAVNTFLANHQKDVINIMLVKDPFCTETDNTSLQDLASYLGGKVITEKTGSLVNKITVDDFVIANSAFSDPSKTLITPKITPTKELKQRIKSLKIEQKKEPEDEVIKRRLSSLTTGVVTIKVGGSTPTEIREKIYRYEDSVNATRSAMKFGYLEGGGMSLLRSYTPEQHDMEMRPIVKRFTESLIRQIAHNCGKSSDSVLEDIKKHKCGYNAMTDKHENLLKAGIVDPFLVIKLSIENAVSVATSIISVDYYIINDLEYERRKNSTRDTDSRGSESE